MIHAGEDSLQVGLLDIITILHHEAENTFHPAIFEERRLPGSSVDEDGVPKVFLVLRYVREEGFPNKEKAETHITELRKKFQIPDQNVFLEPVSWNGKSGKTLTKRNWLIQTEV